MKIFIIGHKSPDLDTVSCAVEYAELLTKIKRYPNAELVPARTDDINKETEFIFTKFGVPLPVKITSADIKPEDGIILVDHNEEDQRLEGIKNEQILEIVDHHKIKINFTTPIRIDVRPLGCASTVIFENFVKEGVKPTQGVGSLIVSSILSDTQGLKSSTTTGWDIKAAEDLAKEFGIDLDQLTFEIFKAKSDISGMSAEEIIMKDYKIFDFSGKKVFIGTVETVEPEKVLDQKAALIKAIEEIKPKLGVGLLFMTVVDILKINCKVIYATEEERAILEKAFNGVGESNVINIGPKTSRKKDIAPPIEEALKN